MIKNSKRIVSGLLSGLIFFTSMPAKAWKEVNPVKEATKDLLSLDASNMIYRTNFLDYDPWRRDHGFLIKAVKTCVHPVDGVLKGAFGAGSPAVMDKEYFKSLCKYKKMDIDHVYKVEIPFFEDSLRTYVKKINFPRLTSVDFCGKRDTKTGHLISNPALISYKAFSRCIKLRTVYVDGDFDFVDKNGDIVNYGNIDLFPLCDHSVIIVCKSEDIARKFKNIMGYKGKRHRIFLESELEKYDIADKSPEKYKFGNPELENASAVIITHASKEYQNILIPKNVIKIEKEAFKESKLVSVTFEEGMKEIEFGDECFAECDLVKFELPKSLKKIVLGKDCFKKCRNAYSIEEYIKSEQRRIQKEEEEERRRKEREEQEKRKRKEAEERDRQAKELEKWKNETLISINKSKKMVEEEIKTLEKDGYEKNIELKVRMKDVEKKQKKKPSSGIEIELKLFKAEQAVLEKEVEISRMGIEVINAKLDGKRQLLKSYVDHAETLKNAKKIDKLFIENIKMSQSLQHLIEEKQKILDDTKEEREKLESVRMEIANKKDELERQAMEQAKKDREQAEKDREQAEESERLRKEREEFEKERNKGFFSNLFQKMDGLNPIKAVKRGMKDKIDSITHGLVAKCKIVAGIVAVVLVVQLCTPIVEFCTSIKKFVQTKKVSSKNLLDINSKDFGIKFYDRTMVKIK
ncbi:MAG: leucine-rich repeat protein [Clostridia bacterium]|nr:leucine-rich repeat protein [Clostridia bacterium]